MRLRTELVKIDVARLLHIVNQEILLVQLGDAFAQPLSNLLGISLAGFGKDGFSNVARLIRTVRWVTGRPPQTPGRKLGLPISITSFAIQVTCVARTSTA